MKDLAHRFLDSNAIDCVCLPPFLIKFLVGILFKVLFLSLPWSPILPYCRWALLWGMLAPMVMETFCYSQQSQRSVSFAFSPFICFSVIFISIPPTYLFLAAAEFVFVNNYWYWIFCSSQFCLGRIMAFWLSANSLSILMNKVMQLLVENNKRNCNM